MQSAELQNPDKHFVTSAQAWLDLGNTDEAENELAQVGYWSRLHPDVLMVRWKVVARLKQWERTLDVARTMIRTSPDRPSGWVCLAYSLCHLERDEDAKAKLIEAHSKFPKVTAIPYFLARLSTKLGQMSEASDWLSKWNDLIETPEQRQTARKDPKLKSLWAYLGEDVKNSTSESESESDSAYQSNRSHSEIKVATFSPTKNKQDSSKESVVAKKR